MINITTISFLMSFFSLVISILTFLLIFRLINKVKEEYNVFSDITKEYIIKKKIQNDIDSLNFNNQVKTHVDRPKTQNELNKTQVEILKIATSMPITARDVMQKFNITREHASRMLSLLNKEGYLKKVNESKPYKYIIDDKGRQYMSDVY
ncbi:MAG: hypothetical protein GU362_02790 [Thaumarchaeota archaeon]|nr:hypothetical protein [Nitrososphaerota archaeon]